MEVGVGLLAQLRDVCVCFRKGIVDRSVRLGVLLKRMTKQSREKRRGKKRNGVFRAGGLLQQWEERLERFGVLDKGLCELGYVFV